jgi:uncharacterized protein (TIGR03435 family)
MLPTAPLPRHSTSRASLLSAIAALTLAWPPPLHAQTPASAPPPAPYTPTLTFDVASIRQSKIDPNVGRTVSGGFTPHSSTFRATNWDPMNLMLAAYGIQPYQLSGMPRDFWWVFFNVQAKSDSDTDDRLAKLNKDHGRLEQEHMLQALLADRFKLKVHWETRQGDVYNLVATKGGPKLRATEAPPSAEELKSWGDHPIPTLYQQGDSRTEFDYIAHGCQMTELVELLAGQFGRPIIDKTGLTGKYDFVLKTHDTKNSDRKDDDTNPIPTLQTAIEDQLGLKLESAKGPIQVLVIDHIEMPSEN